MPLTSPDGVFPVVVHSETALHWEVDDVVDGLELVNFVLDDASGERSVSLERWPRQRPIIEIDPEPVGYRVHQQCLRRCPRLSRRSGQQRGVGVVDLGVHAVCPDCLTASSLVPLARSHISPTASRSSPPVSVEGCRRRFHYVRCGGSVNCSPAASASLLVVFSGGASGSLSGACAGPNTTNLVIVTASLNWE